MNAHIAAGAAVLMAGLILATLLARWAVRPAPGGRDRQPRTVALLRPVEALVTDLAYCPAEERDTLHCFLRTGGRVCMDCRHVTLHSPLTSTPEVGRG